jgi:hypothetical protein
MNNQLWVYVCPPIYMQAEKAAQVPRNAKTTSSGNLVHCIQ